MNDPRSLMAGINTLRMGYSQKDTASSLDQIVCPPWTRRDIGDMLDIRDGLDWLIAEVKSGCMLTQERHGALIRNIDVLQAELDRREKDFLAKARFNPNQPRVPAGSSDGGQWTDGGGGQPSSREPSWGSRLWQETFGSKPAVADTIPHAPKKYPPIPKRPDGTVSIRKEDWQTYHDHIDKGPKVSKTELSVYEKIFAIEGGFKKDPEGTAVAGILQSTLDSAKSQPSLKDKLKDIVKTSDISKKPEVVSWIYKDILDKGLDKVGGSAALDKVGNKYAAAALGDVVFREGKNGAGEIMKSAVDQTLKDNKQPLLDIVREKDVPVIVGPKIFGAYSTLAKNPNTLGSLLDNLAEARKIYRPGETVRPDYYRFENERNH